MPHQLKVLFAATCVFCSAGSMAAGGAPTCDFTPFDSINNGMGAEAGVVREFDSGLTVSPDCLLNGKTWIPIVGVQLTRLSGGPVSIAFETFIRAPAPGAGPPTDVMSDPNSVGASGIPIFPAGQYYEFFGSANHNQNINNVLWGDYQYIGVALNGDTTGLVFITADQSGAPGATPCFTGIDGAVPDDPCTSGNPNLNAAGIGATGYTFYGRYTTGGQVMGRAPLATTFSGRYLSGSVPREASTNLTLREGRDGAIICQFLSIGDDFTFDCPMTAGQVALLYQGGVFAEETIDAETEVTMVIPADIFIFADGFESGATDVWSAVTP